MKIFFNYCKNLHILFNFSRIIYEIFNERFIMVAFKLFCFLKKKKNAKSEIREKNDIV